MRSSPSAVRVVSANWNYGGIDADRSDARWRHTVEALGQVRPHMVLCQEFGVAQPALRQARHVRRTANALGLEPVRGPAPPGARSALHTAVLVDTRSTRCRIHAEGPYPHTRFGGTQHESWCSVELHLPGLDRPLNCYSVHLPARSAVDQLSQAQILAALIAHDPHQLTLVGGDFNCYPRGGPPVTAEELERLPAHLQVTRCRRGPDGGLEANLDVDDAFARAGLLDIAAQLPPTRRDPAQLRRTRRPVLRLTRPHRRHHLLPAPHDQQRPRRPTPRNDPRPR